MPPTVFGVEHKLDDTLAVCRTFGHVVCETDRASHHAGASNIAEFGAKTVNLNDALGSESFSRTLCKKTATRSSMSARCTYRSYILILYGMSSH